MHSFWVPVNPPLAISYPITSKGPAPKCNLGCCGGCVQGKKNEEGMNNIVFEVKDGLDIDKIKCALL